MKKIAIAAILMCAAAAYAAPKSKKKEQPKAASALDKMSTTAPAGAGAMSIQSSLST